MINELRINDIKQAGAKTWLSDKTPLLAALVLSSLMSFAIVLFRAYHFGKEGYMFLTWNLFLAWIPLVSALAFWYFSRYGLRSLPLLVFFFGGWFVFFPNSPYIVTDFLHLAPHRDVPLWYDLLLIFTFAWNGLILGFTSLWIIQAVLEQMAGRWLSWLVVLGTLATSGFGIYLGRFLRWNSWDIFMEPRALAGDIYVRIADPLAYPQSLAVTILFSGFLTVAYLTLVLFTRVHWTDKA